MKVFKKIEAKVLDVLFMRWVNNEFASQYIQDMMDNAEMQIQSQLQAAREQLEAKPERTVIKGFQIK